ncbi:hypothetical protein B0T21DRAFT_416385 [Apiosordaria backusii]|uniref:Uncharacterized protein n=1 Tax=Apiosordaria backusii TaxID=314023 RepID=A0AA40A0S2_9PEZI|nr:hypothetical protein B0T21DRAFT_416385 [Apiosordaria backusii]
MSENDFENNKRSSVVRRLEKPKSLDQEAAWQWYQIQSEYYDFEFAQNDVKRIEALTKEDMIQFFDQYIHPSSRQRAKLAIYLVAQGKISELIAGLGLNAEASAQAATDLQERLSAAADDEEKEVEGLKSYLLHDLKVAGMIYAQNHAQPPSSITPALIRDVRDFKAGLKVTAGARRAKDLSEYEDLN